MNDSLIKLADKEVKIVPEDRLQDFAKLAKNLEYYLPENIERRQPFSSRHDLEYEGYDWLIFFKNLRLDTKPAIKMMQSVAAGRRLKDPMPLIEFLSSLNSIALSQHHQHSGGCF